MTNVRFLCSRGLEHVLNRDPSLLCLPSRREGLSTCAPRCETDEIKMDTLGNGNGGICVFAPLWTGSDWRPILGTSEDTRILPPPLSAKESLLLLSQWIRLPRDDLHIMHATNSWLQPGKVNQALGPDCDDSPHSIRAPPSLDLGIAPYLAVLFGPQKADKDHQDKKVKQEGSQAPEVLLTLRVQVDSCRPADLSALTTILLGDAPAICRNRLLWIQAVKDHF